MDEAADEAAGTTEIGFVGGDLPIWRAREAVRHGEVRLAAQTQATQALEGRAASMLGWSVSGGLALGAAVVHGTHALAASAAGFCLIAASVLCVVALVTREWSAVAGYAPAQVLRDEPGPGYRSEYEMLVALAEGYQNGVDVNQRAFHRFERLLRVAICLMVMAPLAGLSALLVEPAGGACFRPPVIGVRAAWA